MEPVDVATHEMADEVEDFACEGKGWAGVCDALRGSVGEDAFQRWFRAAEWAGEEDGIATITVPGEIHQVWIETNYLPELTVAVNQVFSEVREVRVVVGGMAGGRASRITTATAKHGLAHSRPRQARRARRRGAGAPHQELGAQSRLHLREFRGRI